LGTFPLPFPAMWLVLVENWAVKLLLLHNGVTGSWQYSVFSMRWAWGDLHDGGLFFNLILSCFRLIGDTNNKGLMLKTPRTWQVSNYIFVSLSWVQVRLNLPVDLFMVEFGNTQGYQFTFMNTYCVPHWFCPILSLCVAYCWWLTEVILEILAPLYFVRSMLSHIVSQMCSLNLWLALWPFFNWTSSKWCMVMHESFIFWSYLIHELLIAIFLVWTV
jgi:hypothetical protein